MLNKLQKEKDMHEIDVVSVEDAGYYASERISGSTVRVVLQRDNEFVECDGIVIWQEEYLDDDLFDEWRGYAVAGEKGYKYWQE